MYGGGGVVVVRAKIDSQIKYLQSNVLLFALLASFNLAGRGRPATPHPFVVQSWGKFIQELGNSLLVPLISILSKHYSKLFA